MCKSARQEEQHISKTSKLTLWGAATHPRDRGASKQRDNIPKKRQHSKHIVCQSSANAKSQQADLDIARQVDGELGGPEDMLGLRPQGQQVVWGHPPNEGTLA